MSAFLDRIVARTLDAPIIHRRRDALFAMPADFARREPADDEYDELGDEGGNLTPLTPSTDSAEPAHRTTDRTASHSDVPRDLRAAEPERDIAPNADARRDEPTRSADAWDRGRSELGRRERIDVVRPQPATVEHAVESDTKRLSTEAFSQPHLVTTPRLPPIDPRPKAALPSADASEDSGRSQVRWADAEIVTNPTRAARSDHMFEAADVDDVKRVERRTSNAPGAPVGSDGKPRSMTSEFVELTSLRRDGSVRPDDAPRTAIDDALTINVSIGRIDIGNPPPVIAPPAARPAQPRPTLGDYMRLREKIRAR